MICFVEHFYRKSKRGRALVIIQLVFAIVLSWHFLSLANPLLKEDVPVKGIYHKVRPAKKEPILDAYPNMNDNDIFEQIEVYSARDELAYVDSFEVVNRFSPSISYRISRKQIEESGARDLLDILKGSSGLDVSRESNGYFKVSYLGLREDTRLKLVLDDHLIQDTYSGRNYWNIPADLIECVDIFYGPDSMEFGTGVINGIVRVTSRRQHGVYAHVYGGGFSTYSGSIALGQKNARGEYYLTAQMEAEEGPKLAIEADRFSHQETARDPHDMFTKANRFLLSSAFSSDVVLSKKMDMHLLTNAQIFWQRRGPYIGTFDVVGPSGQLSWLVWKAETKWYVPYAQSNSFNMQFYVNHNVVDNLQQLTPAPYVENDRVHESHVFNEGILSDIRYQVLTLGGEVKNSIYLSKDNMLTMSGQVESTGILRNSFAIAMNRSLDGEPQKLMPLLQVGTNQNQSCYLYGLTSALYGACRMTFSGMVLDEWQIDRPLRLFAGLRLFSFSDVPFDLRSHLNPKVGMIITPGSNWVLKFFLQQGLRLPTFKELYDQSSKVLFGVLPGQFLGNSHLRPELARTASINLAYRETYRHMHYLLETSWHFSKVSNAIEKIDVHGDQNTLNSNGGYYIFGAEARAEAGFQNGSYAFFNVAGHRSYWQELDATGTPNCQVDIFSDVSLKNKCSPITNLPQLRANTGINLLLGRLGTLYAVLQLGAERRHNIRSELERQRSFRIAPYSLFNVSFRSQPFLNYFVLQGSVFNLFNFTTQDDVARPDNLPGLVPREGIAFYVGLNVII